MKKFSKFKKIPPQNVVFEDKNEQNYQANAKTKRNTYLFVRENHERAIQRIKQEFENKPK